MEIEYKWSLPIECGIDNIVHSFFSLLSVKCHEKVHIQAHYYDSEEAYLKNAGCALRIRKENNKEFCYIKAKVRNQGALFVRKEYLVETGSILEGLEELKKNSELSDLLSRLDFEKLIELCMMEFDRELYIILVENGGEYFMAKLDFDQGIAKKKDRQVSINEIEFEFLNGNVDMFEKYAVEFEKCNNLKPIMISKIARILNEGE